MQTPAHLEGLCEKVQLGFQVVVGQLPAGELHPHEKQAGVTVVVLGCLFNVAAALQQKTGHGVDQPQTVRAGQSQYVNMVHSGRIVAARNDRSGCRDQILGRAGASRRDENAAQ